MKYICVVIYINKYLVELKSMRASKTRPKGPYITSHKKGGKKKKKLSTQLFVASPLAFTQSIYNHIYHQDLRSFTYKMMTLARMNVRVRGCVRENQFEYIYIILLNSVIFIGYSKYIFLLTCIT